LLTEFENNDNGNVHVLLKSLDSALRFEREMDDEFNILKELKESKARDEAKAKIKAEEIENQKRLKKDDKLMYIPTDHDAENSADETESGFLGLAHAAVSGGLSGVFDKFLSAYVAYERQQLNNCTALEHLVKTKINPKLESKVDFTAGCDAFMDLVAYCLKVLVYGMMDRLEPHFKIMQYINWGMFSVVGEESAYLHSCNSVLIDAIPNIRGALSSSYFQNFCTKLSTEFIQRLILIFFYRLCFFNMSPFSFFYHSLPFLLCRFLDVILKQKKVSERATN
jgi:hypothetical protein